MNDLTIKTVLKEFTVHFTKDFSFINKLLRLQYYIVIVDSSVYNLYKKQIFYRFPKDRLLVIEFNESRKTLKTVTFIYEQFLSMEGKKNATLISFGGGINQDVTGFVASTLYRGINWILVSTTLLGMADSSIGLKTSLNFKFYKNVLGNFYAPNEIYICVDFLDTLSKEYYWSGIGEIVKIQLMQKNALKNYNNILNKVQILKEKKDKKKIEEIVKETIHIKLQYMLGDEYDLGKRNLLNYGHELGHALESASKFHIPHGIAIVIGIIFANFVSLKRGLLSNFIFERLNNELLLPCIPKEIIKLKKKYFDHEVILNKMKQDKKRVSKNLPLILPSKKFLLNKTTDFSVKDFKAYYKEFLFYLDPYLI